MRFNLSSLPTLPTFPQNGAGFDPLALSFFTRAAITSFNQQSAVNMLVLAMRTAGVISKMTAFWPFVGGTAATHSHNLISASFQGTFNGTVTHDANGITGNGTDGNMSTGMNLNTLDLNNVHLSGYKRTSADSGTMVGAFDGGDGILNIDLVANTDVFGDVNNISAGRLTAASATTGFIVTTRRSSTDAELYRNGVSIATKSGAAATTSFSQVIQVLSRNGAQFLSDTVSSISIGTGLTDAEVTALNLAVQNFQTTLGRQV